MKSIWSRLVQVSAVVAVCAAQLLQARTLRVLYTLKGSPDGSGGLAAPILDKQGNLYSTTYAGGVQDWGSVFEVDTHGRETVLHSFVGGKDGTTPTSGLIADAGGSLYGTTYWGGSAHCFDGNGCGVVYQLSPGDRGWKETILYAFKGAADGAYPGDGTLVRDAAGNFYGTTLYGGSQDWPNGNGVVFKLTHTSQGWKVRVLYAFQGKSMSDGATPYGGVTLDAAGNVYGTTYYGGKFGAGTVFKISAKGAETVLYNFTGGADGGDPGSALIMDATGNLYSTTPFGGDLNCQALYPLGCGTVFKVDPSGAETVLHTFIGYPSDGSGPGAPLLWDGAGNLYGTAGGGNSAYCEDSNNQPMGCGIVFKLDADHNESIVYNFSSGNSGNGPVFPVGVNLIDGSLYGATAEGGSSKNAGTVFELTK